MSVRELRDERPQVLLERKGKNEGVVDRTDTEEGEGARSKDISVGLSIARLLVAISDPRIRLAAACPDAFIFATWANLTFLLSWNA